MSREALKESITRYARDQGKRNRGFYQAVVTSVDPLKFELLNENVVLREDDYDLGWAAKQYKKQKGFEVDDLVVVAREDGDWLILDMVIPVESDVDKLATEDYATQAAEDAVSDLVGGAGLTITGDTIDVGQGDGISVTADAVAVDSTVARKNADNNFSTGQTINGTLSVRGGPAVTTPVASGVDISSGNIYLANAATINFGNAAGTSFQPILTRDSSNNMHLRAGSGTSIVYGDTSTRLGLGMANTSPHLIDGQTGSIVMHNATATTGITSVTIRAGQGQSTNRIFGIQPFGGTDFFSVASDGSLTVGSGSPPLLKANIATTRVGINVASPSTTLDVGGIINTSNAYALGGLTVLGVSSSWTQVGSGTSGVQFTVNTSFDGASNFVQNSITFNSAAEGAGTTVGTIGRATPDGAVSAVMLLQGGAARPVTIQGGGVTGADHALVIQARTGASGSALNLLIRNPAQASVFQVDRDGVTKVLTPSLTSQTAFQVGGVNVATRLFTVDGFGQVASRTDNNGIQNQNTYINAGITASGQGIGFLFRLGSGGTPVDAGYIRVLSEANYSGAANQDSALVFGTSLDGAAVSEQARITSQGTLQVSPAGNPASAINVTGTITNNTDVAGLNFQPTLNGTGAVGQRGIVSTPQFNTPSGTLSEATGVRVRPTFNPTTGATISNAYGVHSIITTGSGGGAISNAYAIRVDNASYGSIKPGSAYGLRIEQQGASGITTAIGISVIAQTGATTNTGIDVGMPDGSGIRVTGSTSSNTQDLTGILSAPTFAGTGTQNSALNLGPTYTVAGATISQGRSLVNRPTFNPGASGVITTASVYRAEPVTGSGGGSITTLLAMAYSSPSYGSIKPTTAKAIDIGNYGAAGVDTAIGIDIGGQSLATTANIGLRVALSTQAAIQLSDTGNTAAGGIQFRGLGNAATLYSSASGIIKTDGTLNSVGGYQVNGTALAASHLSNGTTGSGAVVLATDPALAGTPTAPTAALDTNTTQIATTAYVIGQAGGATPQALGVAAAGTSTRWARQDHVHVMPRLDQVSAPTANVSLNSNKITNLTDPSSAQDAATKAYVDAVKTGLDFKDSVRAVSTSNVSLGAQGSRTVDGVSLASGDRILLAGQTTGSENGIYVVNSDFSLTRSTDADSSAEVTAGLYTFVSEGTTNADSGWVLTTNDAITLGTTALNFTQFSGAGQIVAGAGLTKTGNTIDAVGTAGRILVNADSIDIDSGYVGQTSITTLGTISTGTWQGSVISATYIDSAIARLASPALTGNPTAPTPAVDDNDTSIATTAYVIGQASAAGDGTPAMDGTAARGTSIHWARADHVHPTDTSRAPLASPTFTGTPAAPTAAVDTNTTQLATTAYVIGQASAAGDGTPAALGTAARGSSTHFARADHVHPTTGLAVLASANAFTDAQTITKAGSSALLVRSGAAGSIAQLEIGRTAQEVLVGIAGAADDLTTGTAQGDGVLRHVTAARQLWIGVGTNANEIRIQDDKLGFFNVAPVARPAANTNSSGLSGNRTLPASFTLNDLAKFVIQIWTDLKNEGLLQ